MKRRSIKGIIAIIFLLGFLGSQTVVFYHSHYSVVTHHQNKEAKSSNIIEKCSICAMQSQNSLLFHAPDVFSFIVEASHADCFFMQDYSGVKLIKSSSRSPPSLA